MCRCRCRVNTVAMWGSNDLVPVRATPLSPPPPHCSQATYLRPAPSTRPVITWECCLYTISTVSTVSTIYRMLLGSHWTLVTGHWTHWSQGPQENIINMFLCISLYLDNMGPQRVGIFSVVINHPTFNQLEKLEAAKAAWLVSLSLLSLTGSFLALLGLT